MLCLASRPTHLFTFGSLQWLSLIAINKISLMLLPLDPGLALILKWSFLFKHST